MASTLPPLVLDDSTLAIPRASATQNGYLSKEDFILFSGAFAVPVTSFNTRTGEVILLEDDVLAALGYVPINKSGDTMTGPLLLPAGNPVSSRAAAHKGYVDASVATAGAFSPAKYFPRTWWLSDFKASGSSQQFTGGISSGSHTLTLTTATHDFAVGQGICIVGAGNLASIDAGSNLLVSLITAIAGAAITIADNALHTQTAAVVRHDDTAAVNTAINAVFTAGGGKLLADAGEYWLNGPFTDINSLIKIPFNLASTSITTGGNAFIAIAIEGPPQSFPAWTGPPSTALQGQAIFRTNRTGTAANSMIAAALFDQIEFTALSAVTIYMTNLTWRTYPNPQISAVDMAMAGQGIFNNVAIDCGIRALDSVQPTHGTFGLRCQREAAGMTLNAYNNVIVINYDTGIIISEGFHSTYFMIMLCNVGLRCDFGWHIAMGIGLIWHCAKWILWTGLLAVDLTLDIEVGEASAPVGGSWNAYSPGNDFVDPNNNACGVVRYMKTTGFVGTKLVASNTGCRNLTVINMHGLGNKIAGGISGEIVAQDLRVEGWLRSENTPLGFAADNSGGAGFRDVVVPNTNVGTTGLMKDLTSYWKLDETSGNRLDQMGNNHFTATGIATITGKRGNAASSSGSGWLVVQSPSTENPNGNYAITNPSQIMLGSFSISGWMLLHSLAGPSGLQILLSKWYTNECAFLLLYVASEAAWKFVVTPDGTSTSTAEVVVPATPTLATWYHIAAVYDFPASQIRLRINDGAVGSASAPFSGTMFNSGAALASLGTGSSSGQGFASDAAVDELGLWNRALSASEITALYGAGTPPAFPY